MSQSISISPDQLSEAIQITLRDMLQPVVQLEILRRKQCLTPSEVEALYGIPATTLRNKRCNGCGPAFRQGAQRGTVYYTHEDVKAWFNSLRKRG